MKKNNLVIMLAWPKTPAIQVGSWYEGLMKMLGFNKNGYYMAGHSAIVLVDPESGQLNYFDFGRYHAPVGHGRVRDTLTDPDLKSNINAKFNKRGEISNLHSILKVLSTNKAFHGNGKMYASVNYKVDYEKAFAMAKKIKRREAIPYGPFELKGTNCSRFTSRIFRAGKPNMLKRLRLLLPTSLTPTPLGNVLIAATGNKFYEVENLHVEEKFADVFRQVKNWIFPSFVIGKRSIKTSTKLVLENQQSLINA